MASNGLAARVLASLACAAALTSAAPAFAQDAPVATKPAEAPKRHELAALALGGFAVTDYDHYEDGVDCLTAFGVGAEYAHRASRHLRVGIEGSWIQFQKVHDGHPHGYGDLWTATPFVGAQWGSGAIQGGVRAGLGFAYGGRRSTAYLDRHGPGFDAQLLGELAWVGDDLDLFGRLGLRYARTTRDAPADYSDPRDFPMRMAFVTLGVRWTI